jgi:hypothetical protein
MKRNQGFIKLVIIIVIALIVLGYFGFDVRDAIESPTTQKNFNYVQKFAWEVWNNYLKDVVMYIWNNIVLKLTHKVTS